MTAPDPYPSAGSVAAGTRTDVGDVSVGTLVSRVTDDITTLMRQEFALAKAELSSEVSKAGKGAGLLGGAGLAGWMLALFASLTLMYLLDLAVPRWAAALVVTALWGVGAAVLYSKGRQRLRAVDPTPHQTIETLKEMR